MLDMKFVRDNSEIVIETLKKRGTNINLDKFLVLEAQRRKILVQVEALKNQPNIVSNEISMMKKHGKENNNNIIIKMREVGDNIVNLDKQLKDVDEALIDIILRLPNLPHFSVPIGTNEAENIEVRRFGTPRIFNKKPYSHWDIGEKLGILDFERGSKVTGSRFSFYCGFGARLERSLINFMLDLHTSKHGFTEIFPPFIVNRKSMVGTGQLPKFSEDIFKLEGLDYYLIPTAEVPITNYHSKEILDGAVLPLNYVAYSACFRSEAGASGRDTRGLIRQHQFNKIEMVKFVKPENSYNELENLTISAEKVLKLLNLPYRVMLLCTGDLGAASAKTYDLEIWLPSANKYCEVSSCSNFEDYQARRADIKFRRNVNSKPEYLHTLNGSGIAIGRTVAAILENYQQDNGTVIVPKVLRSYMGIEVIK